MKTLKASLDCLKTKNSVTFTLPQLKGTPKGEPSEKSNEEVGSRSGSLDQLKQKIFSNSNQNFYFGGQ
jgi:hypothetical protein